MEATSITITRETGRLLESLKVGGATYDDVIRGLLVSHPTELTIAELARRIREGKPHSIEQLIRKSGQQGR
jgi:hypothetical protein